MMKLTWEEIHKVLGGELRGEGTDQRITSVVIDSRKVTPGALFVAMQGERVDSHQFIAECYEKGAVACLCEKTYAETHEISVPEGKLLWIVPETVQAMGNLAAYYRKKLGIPVIGVTGSVGKTTAKDMIAAALSGGLKVFKTPGNLNNQYGLPLAIFQIEEDTQAAVLEMGMNHFGEIRYLSHIAKPDVGVITNIGVSHIEFLGSQEGILKAKTEMFEEMKEDGPAFLCGDDPLLLSYSRQMKRPVWRYGFSEDCEIRALWWKQVGDEIQTLLHCDGEETLLTAKALGKHMVYAMLAAFGIGRHLGLSPETLVKGIASFQPSAMRMNVYENDRFRILDDSYNASPASMQAALDVLCAQKFRPNSRRVAVLGDMLEMGFYSEKGHRQVGQYAAEHAVDVLVGVGKDAAWIVEEALKVRPTLTSYYFENTEILSKKLFSLLRPDDIILLKASRRMALDKIVQMIK